MVVANPEQFFTCMCEINIVSFYIAPIQSYFHWRVHSKVESKIESKVESKVEHMVGSEVTSEVKCKVESKIKSEIEFGTAKLQTADLFSRKCSRR